MGSSSSAAVVALTAAALATVGFLGHRASENVPAELREPESSASPSAVAARRADADPTALPLESGSGERVVYALDDDRVWLVGPNGKTRRTFRVVPSTVDPPPGEYAVTSRSNRVTGSDGVPVEHVVRFADVEGVVVGFSAAVDGSTPKPDPGLRTGGIRESRADGEAMWQFATIGQQVVVVR
ncbi:MULTISPECIES: hypothetical protein [unclassified Streptomyces]|uniref:hypothetical protein n=1 Tax=unclassified Streptomyces TaxID=2593676 RepID=UPI001903452E|nr:hypothetical protein [Streptomyces sp. HSG2]